jgi:hypothetical protein
VESGEWSEERVRESHVIGQDTHENNGEHRKKTANRGQKERKKIYHTHTHTHTHKNNEDEQRRRTTTKKNNEEEEEEEEVFERYISVQGREREFEREIKTRVRERKACKPDDHRWCEEIWALR